ncbi:MAG: hypothetical protein KJ622_13910 [Alphaproteobacteria bacterium]|nr:hypothetical protein [Alphaproteobacteria bacterium]
MVNRLLSYFKALTFTTIINERPAIVRYVGRILALSVGRIDAGGPREKLSAAPAQRAAGQSAAKKLNSCRMTGFVPEIGFERF